MPKRVAWLCWGLAAAAVIGTGVASTSTALIITSFAFVGSSL